MSANFKATCNRMMEARNKDDVDGMLADLADDCKWTNYMLNMIELNKAALKEWFSKEMGAFSEPNFKVRSVSEPATVEITGTMKLNVAHPAFAQFKAGDVLVCDGVLLCQVDGAGKITHVTQYITTRSSA